MAVPFDRYPDSKPTGRPTEAGTRKSFFYLPQKMRAPAAVHSIFTRER
jgi:hypothetical protein